MDTETTARRQPDDLMAVSWEECVWGLYGDWINAPMESVVDASTMTRGQAIAAFAREADCAFTEVRCTVGYGRILTRQEAWENDNVGPVPDDWMGYEETPCWTHYIDYPLGVEEGVTVTKLYLLEVR